MRIDVFESESACDIVLGECLWMHVYGALCVRCVTVQSSL